MNDGPSWDSIATPPKPKMSSHLVMRASTLVIEKKVHPSTQELLLDTLCGARKIVQWSDCPRVSGVVPTD
jgi:hypothetical protein